MIFVTGATGLLGSQLVKNLVAKGKNVCALKRPTSNLALLGNAAKEVQWIEGDLNEIDTLQQAMQGVEYVYHCAALISFQKKDCNALFKTNVEGTANVMNAALANGVKKLVHVSSVAAFGFHPKGKTIDEKSIYNESEGLSYYFKSKHFGEREAWRAQAEGLNVVVANPSTILGGGWWHLEPNSIFLQLKKGLPFYSNGSQGFVDVRDAAKALEILMEKATNGSQYIISAENASFKDLLTQIAKQLHVKPPFISLHPLVAKAAIYYSSASDLLFDKKPLLTAEKYLIASSSFEYSNRKFVQDFNYRFLPLSQTITDSCNALEQSLKAGKEFGVLG